MDIPTGSSSNNRFVCPNDRQLALRAKLKTGWSVKMGSLRGNYPQTLENKKSQPLMPHEQEAIVAVIRRAEELDLIEQKRVGCLVERLEKMRKKVLNRTSSQCLLCADTFGLLKAQKLICMDCKRAVCQKCAIDSCGNSKNRCSTSTAKDHYLCMICSESREIWKKSGAWFFKSIPKYILPEESISSTSATSSLTRKERKFREKPNRNRMMIKDGGDDSTISNSSSTSSEEDWKFRKKENFNERNSTGDVKNHSSSSLQHLDLKADMMSSMNVSFGGQKNDGKIETPEDGTETTIRRKLSLSKSLNDWENGCRSDGKISPLSTCSLNSGIFKMNDGSKVPNSTTTLSGGSNIDLSLGTMDLSLIYDPINSTLHCTVYRAKNLIPMDINGLADPYCKLNILPTTKTSTRLRTKTIHKTRNPEFNENLTFYDISEGDLLNKRLHIIVLDEDKYGHDFMGETKINLAKLRVQNTIYLTLALENMNEQKGPLPGPELSKWFDDLSYRGQILLSLCYNTRKRALIVTVIKCTNLLPMDNNGYSDPFVKLQLKPDPNRKKYKTSIKWKELNPVWNEEFAFETRPTELSTQSLCLAVYDKDYGKSDDYLGGLILGGIGSKGQRLKHWLDMIRYPDHHHECWHNLSEEITK